MHKRMNAQDDETQIKKPGGPTCKKKNPGRSEQRRKEPTLTVVAAPVDVDAASVVAGELREREAGGVGCGHGTRMADYTLACQNDK